MVIKGLEAIKQNSEEGDSHKNGEICYIIAQLDNDLLKRDEIFYFVLYENDNLNLPIGTLDYKLRRTGEVKEINLNIEQETYMNNINTYMNNINNKIKLKWN